MIKKFLYFLPFEIMANGKELDAFFMSQGYQYFLKLLLF